MSTIVFVAALSFITVLIVYLLTSMRTETVQLYLQPNQHIDIQNLMLGTVAHNITKCLLDDICKAVALHDCIHENITFGWGRQFGNCKARQVASKEGFWIINVKYVDIITICCSIGPNSRILSLNRFIGPSQILSCKQSIDNLFCNL